MPSSAINFSNKFAQFTDLWSPRIIAQMNDYHFKLVRIQGEFVWHSHPETDEVFIVIKGSMQIHLRKEVVYLSAGEMYVVPKGVEHKPTTEQECHILLIEPAGTLNTGNAGGEMTHLEEVWV